MMIIDVARVSCVSYVIYIQLENIFFDKWKYLNQCVIFDCLNVFLKSKNMINNLNKVIFYKNKKFRMKKREQYSESKIK